MVEELTRTMKNAYKNPLPRSMRFYFENVSLSVATLLANIAQSDLSALIPWIVSLAFQLPDTNSETLPQHNRDNLSVIFQFRYWHRIKQHLICDQAQYL